MPVESAYKPADSKSISEGDKVSTVIHNKTMKFFLSILGASILASEIQQRDFVDNSAFLLADGSANWNDDFAVALSEDIVTGTELFFSLFFTDDYSRKYLKFGERARLAMERTMRDMVNRDQKCIRFGDTVNEPPKTVTRWNLPTSSFHNAFKQIYFQYASWIKEQIYPNCPRRAMTLLKRVARFKLIMMYKHCTEVDPTLNDCNYRYQLSDDSSVKTPLIEMPHPRKWVKNIYGKHKDLEFTEHFCDAESIQEIACPFDHRVSIQSATYGRTIGRMCGGDGKICKSSVDLTAEMNTTCGDNEEEACSFYFGEFSSIGNFTDCDGRKPYFTVNFKCL